jgi:hypothetical protein
MLAEAHAVTPQHSNVARENGVASPPVGVDVAREVATDSPVIQLAVVAIDEGADSTEAHKDEVDDS